MSPFLQMLLLVQTNVSARVDHEVRMTLMNEAQMGMLEQVGSKCGRVDMGMLEQVRGRGMNASASHASGDRCRTHQLAMEWSIVNVLHACAGGAARDQRGPTNCLDLFATEYIVNVLYACAGGGGGVPRTW